MKSKNNFNIKNEAIFMALVSHSQKSLETLKEDEFPQAFKLASNLVNHFTKNKVKRYTPKQANKIVKYLKEKIEPILDNNNSPVIHMIIVLNYLINETNHIETKRYFFMYKTLVSELLYSLECSLHSDLVYDHFSKLDKII